MEDYTRVLGIATYEARWVQRSSLVRLTARGILPCSNYLAQLEQRPERIIPPMWDMVFYAQDWCQRAIRPFEESTVMVNSSGATSISVRDAMGTHDVPIQQAFELEGGPAKGSDAAQEEEQFVVYGKLPKPDTGHQGCIVVPSDSMVTAIHYRAFGPASREDCEMFIQSNCAGTAFFDVLASGEIPWPLAN